MSPVLRPVLLDLQVLSDTDVDGELVKGMVTGKSPEFPDVQTISGDFKRDR